MALRPAGLREPEPISPELVLVSPPEVARRAREELREPPVRETTASVREQLPEPPARAAASQPSHPSHPSQPPSRRRWGRVAAAGVTIGAIGAAAAYVVVTRDDTGRVGDPAAVSASATSRKPATQLSTRATKTTIAATAGATRARPRHTAKAAAPRRRARTSARPGATAPRAATPKPTVEPKRPKRTAKPKRTQQRQPTKRAKQTKQQPGFIPARTWTWPTSDGARAYVLRFLLNGRVVLQQRTAQPRLVLPRTFRFRAGTYRWLVERIPAARNGRPIVDSTFVLTRATAVRANR